MKKRIVPELFRNNIYHNYFLLNYINFTKNTNSILLFQDFELKRYIKDFFFKYKLDIQQILINRTFNQLNINLHYFNNLAYLNNYNETLFDKLNFYKFYTMKNLVSYELFDIHTIVSQKLYYKSSKKKRKVDFIIEKIYDSFYMDKFFFYLNKPSPYSRKGYQYLRPYYSYLKNMFNLPKFSKVKPPKVKDAKFYKINQNFWNHFNIIKNVEFTDYNNKGNLWFNLLYSQPNYPFFKKPVKEKSSIPVTFFPSYTFKKYKKKEKFKFISPYSFKRSNNLYINKWRLELKKKTDLERKSLVKNFYSKIKFFIKKFKNLNIFYKDYFNYLNLKTYIPLLKPIKINLPIFDFKFQQIYNLYFNKVLYKYKKRPKIIKKYLVFLQIKDFISFKFKLLILLCVNFAKFNKYLYYKLFIKTLKNVIA